MRFAWFLFLAITAEALLLALEVGLGVATGSPFSWASAAFIAVMCGLTLTSYARSRF